MKKRKKKKATRRARVVLPTEKTIIAQLIHDYIIAIYGPPGIGKTEFADKLSDRTFFISTDRGTRYRYALREEVHTWEELIEVIVALEKQPSLYKIIALDHIDDICVLADIKACKMLDIEALEDAGYSKGWKLYKKLIWSILERLLALDTGIVLIIHETIKTIKTAVTETQRTMPDLTKSAWKVLIPKCDLVGYCGWKKLKLKGKNKRTTCRIIHTSPTESIYCKDRTQRRKPEEGFELLDGEAFAQTFVKKGKQHGKKVKKVKKVK